MRLSEELAAGKLVKNLTLFPALQITLVHPDMTREFEQACQVLYSDPLLLLGKIISKDSRRYCQERTDFFVTWLSLASEVAELEAAARDFCCNPQS